MGRHVRPPRAVELDFDSGYAVCPAHGRQAVGSEESRAAACTHVRQALELRAMGMSGWRVTAGGPVVEVRS